MNANRFIVGSDLELSRVIIGLWQVADLERNGQPLDVAKSAEAMQQYFQAGLTSFDMADHYGSAEIIAGHFNAHYAHGKAQLLTKWVPSPAAFSKTTVREAVHKAMTRLQTERINLLQFHAWNYADPGWLDNLFELHRLKEEGLIQCLGLTNFDTAHAAMAIHSGIAVSTNQVCFSLLDQRASGAMTQLCLQHNIKLLAFGTVAGGFLSERWLNKPEPVLNESLTWSQMKYKRFIDTAGGWQKFQALLLTLHTIAQAHQTSIANVASRFMVEQPAVGGVIIGARLGNSEHIQDNVNLLSLRLSDTDKKTIQQALQSLQTIPGDCGDEYRKPPFLTASGDLSHHIEQHHAPYPIKSGADGRTKALSGTIWEDIAGFSRATRKGKHIRVSGTTATHGNQVIGLGDAAMQTHFVLDKIEGAIQSLGGTLNDVIRTRIYIKNMHDWEAVARVHGERFQHIQPANTMVQAGIIGDDYLVEIEAEALVGQFVRP